MTQAVRPLVSCVMPTFDRRRFVPDAIDGFWSQTYPDRELVIVDDGTDPIADLVPDDPMIRYVRLDQRLKTGAKRNAACRAARGDVIVHWDDDDWSSPRSAPRCRVGAARQWRRRVRPSRSNTVLRTGDRPWVALPVPGASPSVGGWRDDVLSVSLWKLSRSRTSARGKTPSSCGQARSGSSTRSTASTFTSPPFTPPTRAPSEPPVSAGPVCRVLRSGRSAAPAAAVLAPDREAGGARDGSEHDHEIPAGRGIADRRHAACHRLDSTSRLG